MLKISRKAKRIAAKEQVTVYDARQFFSYYSWLKHTDSYNFNKKHIEPYVSINKLKAVLRVTKRSDADGMAKIRKC